MIKLENINKKLYNRQTGELETVESVEFVCPKCRHLVNEGDSFCWFCGECQEHNIEVEHYVLGKKLTNDEFKEAKKKSSHALKSFVDNLPRIDN